jgi:hypothetical protein
VADAFAAILVVEGDMELLRSLKWGDVPTWFAAIGTIATFVVYYFLLRGEIRKREEEKREAERHTQKRVAAWIDIDKLKVQNLGEEPVYDLVVYYGPMGTDFDHIEDPGWIELVIGTAGPGQKMEEDIDAEWLKSGHFPNVPEVGLEFTDCNGSHWRRESTGRLHPIAFRRPFD